MKGVFLDAIMKSHIYLEDGEDLVMEDLNDLDACMDWSMKTILFDVT